MQRLQIYRRKDFLTLCMVCREHLVPGLQILSVILLQIFFLPFWRVWNARVLRRAFILSLKKNHLFSMMRKNLTCLIGLDLISGNLSISWCPTNVRLFSSRELIFVLGLLTVLQLLPELHTSLSSVTRLNISVRTR